MMLFFMRHKIECGGVFLYNMANRGKIWTEAELTQLHLLVEKGTNVDEIAVMMGRSSPAITARIGMTMAVELSVGSADDVAARWKKTPDDVTMFVAKYTQIDRSRGPRMSEIIELLQVLAAAVLDPASVTDAQREYVRAALAEIAPPQKDTNNNE